MRIGVNTRFLLKHKMEGFGWYTFETLKRIVKWHPEHEFIFFFDRPYDPSFVFEKNVTPIVVNPPARHPILFKLWFDYGITYQLKKQRCDAFISPDGYLSLRTKTPQLAVIHDINFEHIPEDIPKNALTYLKKYFPKFAHKAQRICTVSEYSKQDIISTYGVAADKIDVTYNGASSKFQPLPTAEQEEIRKKYTKGKPYILFVGAIHKRKNLQRLIEAYTLLRKQNKSESERQHPHQLLIVGEQLWDSQSVVLPHELKEEIHFTGHLNAADLAKVTASATLLTFVSYFEGFGIPIVEAMQCGTPVLSGNKTALPEIGGDAVHYCDPYSVENIYEALNTLLSSPDLLEAYRKKGIARAKSFSWDYTAEKLWESFERMVKHITP